MMRHKTVKGYFGKRSDGTVQVYECDRCGARRYAPGLGDCPLCGCCGKPSDRYVTALDTVDSYMPARYGSMRGAKCGWPSLRRVCVAVVPGLVTIAHFDLDGVGIDADREGIGVSPFTDERKEAFLLALDGIHRYEPRALAEELVRRVVKDLGARHAAE